MPCPFIGAVKISGVSAIDPMHYFQQIPFRCFKDNVIVVVHEYIAVDQYSVTFMVIFDDFEKVNPVLIRNKYRLSFIPSAGNMIHSAWIFYPEWSPHAETILQSTHNVKYQGLTPFIVHLGCFEKMANAFFRISLSSLRLAFSFCSFLNSSSWGFRCPFPGKLPDGSS